MENPFEIIIARLTAIECLLIEITAVPNKPKEAPTPGRIMNLAECAAYVGFVPQTIYRKTSAGEMPYSKRGGRLYFDREAIDKWLLDNRYGRVEAEKRAEDYLAGLKAGRRRRAASAGT
jgi:excisionase family DNA binding protein